MRPTFSRLLVEAARADEKLLLLTGDHGYALFDQFRAHCPDRFINCGVAEQNMVGVAAGLAKGGFHPLVYGLSSFVPMRVLEQIKMDVCYQALPVLLIGDGAGMVYGKLGASHQCNEDVGALRSLPHIEIHSPADRFELEYCFAEMRRRGKPAYLRFGKADCGDIHSALPQAPLGDLVAVCAGRQRAGVIATGSMVFRSAAIARRMGVPVWSMPSLSPVNREQLAAICGGLDHVVTVEEHSVNGGLGSLVAEVIAESAPGTRLSRMGIRGQFAEECGSWEYLVSKHGLGVRDIEGELRRILDRLSSVEGAPHEGALRHAG